LDEKWCKHCKRLPFRAISEQDRVMLDYVVKLTKDAPGFRLKITRSCARWALTTWNLANYADRILV